MKKLTAFLLAGILILTTACNIPRGNSPRETEIFSVAESYETFPGIEETTVVPETSAPDTVTSIDENGYIIVNGEGVESAPETFTPPETTETTTVLMPVGWKINFSTDKSVYGYGEGIRFTVENLGDKVIDGGWVELCKNNDIGRIYHFFLPIKLKKGEKYSESIDVNKRYSAFAQELISGEYIFSCHPDSGKESYSKQIPVKIDLGKGGYLSITHERSGMSLVEPYDEQDVTFTFKNTGKEKITLGDKIVLESGANDRNEWQAVKEIPYMGKKELDPNESVEFVLRYKDAYLAGKDFFNGRMAMPFTCGGNYKAYSVFGIQPKQGEPVYGSATEPPVTSIIASVPETIEPSPTADRIKAEISTNQDVYGEHGDIEVTVKNIGNEDFVVNFISLENAKGEEIIYKSPYVILGKNKSHTVRILYPEYYYNNRIDTGDYKIKCRLVSADLKDYRDFEVPIKMDLGDVRSLKITHAKDSETPYIEEDITFTLKNTSGKKLTLIDDAFTLRVYEPKDESDWKWSPIKHYKCRGKNVLLPGETAEFTLPCKDALSGGKNRYCMLIVTFANENGESFSNFAKFTVQTKDCNDGVTLGE